MNEFVIDDLRREVECWVEKFGVLTLLSCISDVCADSCRDAGAFPNCADFKCRVAVEISHLIRLSTAKDGATESVNLTSGLFADATNGVEYELEPDVVVSEDNPTDTSVRIQFGLVRDAHLRQNLQWTEPIAQGKQS